MQVRLELMRTLPDIIRESVKPMKQIDGLKIIQVDGLTNAAACGVSGEQAASTAGNLSNQLVNSALRYRGQAPLVDSLLSETGNKGSDINGLTDALKPDRE